MKTTQSTNPSLLGAFDLSTGPCPVGNRTIKGWALSKDQDIAAIKIVINSKTHLPIALEPTVVERPDVNRIHSQYIQLNRPAGIEVDFEFDGTQDTVQMWAILEDGNQYLIDRCVFSQLRRLFFVHVPKSGGTSIKKFLRQQYPPELSTLNLDTKRHLLNRKHLKNQYLITGHVSYISVEKSIPLDEACTVLVLREPRKRLKSHLTHFANYKLLRRRSLFLQMNDTTQRFIERIATEPLRNYCAAMDNVFRYNLDNRMVRQLTKVPLTRAVNEADAQLALKTLEKLTIIGTLEHIDLVMAQICRQMNWEMPAKVEHANRAPRKRPFDEADDEAVEQLTRYDQIVFERAQQLMAKQVEIMCQLLSSLYPDEPVAFQNDLSHIDMTHVRELVNRSAKESSA